MIDSRLLKSLDTLTRQKQVIGQKAARLAKTERRLIGALGRALSTAGYRVVPLGGRPLTARPLASMAPAGVKRLRCPKCPRRFSHPLPMARHMAATHSARAAGKKAPARALKKKAGKTSA